DRPGSRPSATSAPALCDFSRAPRRAATTSATIAPTLWRLAAYRGPGIPSPTIRNASPDIGGSVLFRHGLLGVELDLVGDLRLGLGGARGHLDGHHQGVRGVHEGGTGGQRDVAGRD